MTLPDLPALSDADVAHERAVLGSVLTFPGELDEAAAVLKPEHFGLGAHHLVFAAMLRLSEAGVPADPAAVLGELTRAGTVTKVGAPDGGTAGAYLHTLMQSWGSIAAHAPRVLAAWQVRNARLSLLSAVQIAFSPACDPDTHFDQIRQLVDDATAGMANGELKSQADILTDVLDDLQNGVTPGVPTGFADLDDAIGSLRPGTLTVIGARPAVGKTALAMTIADHIASRCGLAGLFSSLEMSPAELMHRRIAATAKVSMDALTKHQLSERDWDRISAAHDRLASSPMVVDGKEGASLSHIRAQLRSLARGDNPPRWAVIDQLGLMDAGRAENRQVAVAGLSRGLKNLAREFGIPVLLLVQINRGPEQRTDKVPVMSDLRESGQIEADADIVLLLHREDYYERESPRAGEVDVIVAKNRQGPQTTVTLAFQGHYARMVSMAKDDAAPSAGDAWSAASDFRGAA